MIKVIDHFTPTNWGTFGRQIKNSLFESWILVHIIQPQTASYNPHDAAR